MAGFRFARQSGEPSFLREKRGVPRPVVIPTSDEVPVSVIRNNLKTAGIIRDEYFKLLEKS